MPLPTVDAIPRAKDAAEGGLRDVFVTSTHLAPVPEGAPDVAIVLVRPRWAAADVPWLLYLHDGDLVSGTAHDGLDGALDIARHAGCAVASVEYRLAPDAPYPAAVEDVYAALVWLVDNASELGLDPDRFVVSGVGAGAGLAAATTLLARDLAWPRIAGQLLIRPMLDDRSGPVHGWQAYLEGLAGGPDVPAYAAPARARALGGLPPAFIEAGASDGDHDQGVAYATQLWLCGGTTELHGARRGSGEVRPPAAQARVDWLRRVLSA